MENANRASLDAVGKSMRQIRKAVGAARIDPRLLTYAEKLQYEGFQRREETNASILSLSQEGVAIREIVLAVRSNPTCRGWTNNGPPAAETASHCGEPCANAAFAAAAAW